jgi:hypothetical protein
MLIVVQDGFLTIRCHPERSRFSGEAKDLRSAAVFQAKRRISVSSCPEREPNCTRRRGLSDCLANF